MAEVFRSGWLLSLQCSSSGGLEWLHALSTIQTLICPLCRGELELEATGVRCSAGHSFDFARQGYVNLVTNRPSVRIR